MSTKIVCIIEFMKHNKITSLKICHFISTYDTFLWKIFTFRRFHTNWL